MDDAFDEVKAEKPEAERRLEALLVEHVEMMDAKGMTFEHTFDDTKLRFTVALARYGRKGREFVEVDSTGLDCDCAELRPRDELISVDGVVLADVHTPDFFKSLQRRIRDGARPITLKFVKGAHRDAAYALQEETRLAKHEAFSTPETTPAMPPLQVAITRLDDDDPFDDDPADAETDARGDCRGCCLPGPDLRPS